MFYFILALLSSFISYALSWPQREEETCKEGFGTLANFCGIYDGMVTKEVDRQEKCSLLQEGDVLFEVMPTREIRLYFEGRKRFHKIGKIPLNASSFEIDVSRRDCSPLKGVLSQNSGCKILNLEGSFFYSGGK